MDNLNMPSNSESSKTRPPEDQSQRKVKLPTLSNAPDPSKQNSLWHKIKDSMLQGRNPEDVATWVITGVVIPAIMDGIANAGKAAIDSVFYPDGRGNSQTQLGVGVRQNYSWSSMTRQPTQQTGRVIVSGGTGVPQNGQNFQGGNTRYLSGFTNIRFASYSDAEAVANYMYQTLNEYDIIPLSEFYDACGEYAAGITRTSVMSKWGWPRGTEFPVRRAAGSWIINMPDPIAL